MRLFSPIALALLVGAAIIGWQPQATPVQACTGGIGFIEDWAPGAELIVIGQAIAVGDDVNRAPTMTPTLTPTATATAPKRTPTIPPPPPSPTPYWGPPPPNAILNGVGATLNVERVIAGSAGASIEVDGDSRAYIERALREWEAGHPQVTSCTMDAFVPRFERGGRYLVFLADRPDRFVHTILRLDGDAVRLDDPLLVGASNGTLWMQRTTFDRYFAATSPLPADSGETVFLTSGRVPLKTVLQAVAGLRGDPSILPPDTGSAGLAADRR